VIADFKDVQIYTPANLRALEFSTLLKKGGINAHSVDFGYDDHGEQEITN
jgi:hypothetical protein